MAKYAFARIDCQYARGEDNPDAREVRAKRSPAAGRSRWEAARGVPGFAAQIRQRL
jgi:hypothetical protein